MSFSVQRRRGRILEVTTGDDEVKISDLSELLNVSEI